VSESWSKGTPASAKDGPQKRGPRRAPAIVVYRAMREHLETVGAVLARRIRIVKSLCEGHTRSGQGWLQDCGISLDAKASFKQARMIFRRPRRAGPD
jgi:hypothetical protein